MIIVIVSLLTVLFICDLILIFYCKVKNGFRMFAFRFFAILLAIMSLIMTGDIQIAYGAQMDIVPKYEKQNFIKHINNCVPYSVEVKIGYDNKIGENNKKIEGRDNYNYVSNESLVIEGLYDDGTCHLTETTFGNQLNPPADAADTTLYRVPKKVLNKLNENNIDKYLQKYLVFCDDIKNNAGEYIPSLLTKEQKEEIKKHFKTDNEADFTSWYLQYMDSIKE